MLSQTLRKRVSTRKELRSSSRCSLEAQMDQKLRNKRSMLQYRHKASASQAWAMHPPCPPSTQMTSAQTAPLSRVKILTTAYQCRFRMTIKTTLRISKAFLSESSRQPHRSTTLTISRQAERSSHSQATCSMSGCQQHALKALKVACSQIRAH